MDCCFPRTASDYILLNSSVVLTLGVNNYSVFMNFIDDEIPEPEMEDVVITFTEVPSIDFNEAASITITIQDDDGKSRHFQFHH